MCITNLYLGLSSFIYLYLNWDFTFACGNSCNILLVAFNYFNVYRWLIKSPLTMASSSVLSEQILL